MNELAAPQLQTNEKSFEFPATLFDVTYTAPPVHKYVASASVNEYVASALVNDVTPRSQTIEKIVEFPEIRTIQSTRTSESLETAPGRHVAFLEVVEMVDLEPPLSVEAAPPMFETAPVVEAAPVMVEYVQPAPVVEYVTPAPAVTYAAPTPEAEPVQVPQVRIVQKTIKIPQRQIVEKSVEIPDVRTIQSTRISEVLGTAPGRHVAFSEVVGVAELGQPLPAESAPPMFVTATVIRAPLVVVENVQLAPVFEYVAPAPAVTYAAHVPVAESVPQSRCHNCRSSRKPLRLLKSRLSRAPQLPHV